LEKYYSLTQIKFHLRFTQLKINMKPLYKITHVLSICSLVVIQACTMAKISGKSSKPLVLNNPNTETEVIRSLEETQLKAFDYTSSIDIYEIVKDAVANSESDAITNITVKLKKDPVTFIVNVGTLWIAQAYKVEVTGDLVRLPNGVSSVKSLNEKKLSNIVPPQNDENKILNLEGYLTAD